MSYCWGDLEDLTPVDIDGFSINVTRNLRTALFHMRKIDQARWLWADAICINQENLFERAEQVSIMGDIYRSAVRTLIWLGPSDETTAIAFAGCQKLLARAASGQAVKKSAEPRKEKPILDANSSDFVSNLVGKTWWTRVWTVQEVILAQDATIICGWHNMDWRSFKQAISTGIAMGAWDQVILGSVNTELFPGLRVMNLMSSISQVETAAERLLQLLLELRKRRATDPRDKIFSCLGLVNDASNDLNMKPDYQTPTENVYIGAAKAIIISSHKLDILGAISVKNGKKETSLELPSWVPDWSIDESFALPFCKDIKGQMRNFSASRGSLASPSFIDHGMTLVVSGYIYDEISELGEPLADMGEQDWELFDEDDDGAEKTSDQKKETTWKEDWRKIRKDFGVIGQSLGKAATNFLDYVPYLATFVQWEKLAAIDKPSTNPKSLSPEEIYWRTLCTDQTVDGYAETLRQYSEWRTSLNPIRNLSRWKVNSVSSVFRPVGFASYIGYNFKKWPEFIVLLAHMTYRRLGRTKRGHLCVVPEAAQVGDKMALCCGGQAPLVLRQQGGNYYALLGEAFILEIMNGEAFDKEACAEIRIH